MNQLARRFQHREERARNVLDVHERPPRRPVALDEHFAGRDGVADEAVHDDVGTKARRHAVSSGVPQEYRAEAIGGELGDVAFDEHLGLTVRRDRVERRLFGQQAVVRRDAVQTAGRGEEIPLDAGFTGQTGQPHRRQMIDVVGELRIQVAERIVRQGGEVNHRVEAGELGRLDPAHVGANRRHLRAFAAEGAFLEKIRIQPDDLVTRADEDVHHHGADIAVVTGYQYSHSFTSCGVRTQTFAVRSSSSQVSPRNTRYCSARS